jgi:hypothetical protein
LAGLIFPFAPADEPQPGVDVLRARGPALVDELASGDFGAALGAFDRTTENGVTIDKLRDEWKNVVNQHGALRQRVAGSAIVRGTGIILPIRCSFANNDLDAVLFCTLAGKVSRLVYIPPPLDGPGLIRAEMAEVFRVKEPGVAGKVTFPIPGTYRDQVPLAFRIEVQPPDALKGSRLIRRADGMNWLCEVEVAPPKDKAMVRWEALVFVGGRPTEALPRARKPEVPEETQKWTRSAGCVQSDDPGIQAKAAALAEGTDDVGEYASRVIRFTTMNPYRAELCRTLDARGALLGGSSCTGRANLAAALLRARGIPARTVAHLPTWCGPLFTHWLVEYWHPGVGWVWMEPTLDQPQPPSWTAVVVNVSKPSDEDDAFGWTRTSGIAAGVPRHSARELTAGLQPLFDVAEQLSWGAVNRATPETPLRGSTTDLGELSTLARRTFAEWAVPGRTAETDRVRMDRLLAAARTGDVKQVAKVLQTR